ncbi:aspartate kinase [Caldanaerobius fijiensis DSM 17918]|uniref:Aspartokinase n=1 Tax=Caldanaerobius fijiensis DSM 17918 TaxID=1121256 RepID=A0A1M4WRL1_9THEO|nr:aspartate kinase [Caldanaerobius fijiensis]SHE83693.1 aspartate kinase [Caldanaerobius fijiensis DSM 17918]
MKILVQKFGGTSVATPERREMVMQKIFKAREKGYKCVVVVSAMGRKGDTYATDTLINLVKAQGPYVSLRELDLLMSCGEIISSVVMASSLLNKGVKAVALTGAQAGIITNENFGNAEVLRVEPYRILEYLEEDYVPVVAGFQGVTEKGDITTLSRGGSDFTASILGEALGAEAIEIYTDVDGIMTADPRIVQDARIIDKINYSEVFQMAEQGAKVIHPRAVEVAMRANIPLIIKNTMSDHPGTIIGNYNELYASADSDRLITAIAHITDRVQFRIELGTENTKLENEIFDQLSRNHISIDLINVFPEKLIFTVDENKSQQVEQLLNKRSLKYDVYHNCGIVSVIGQRMRGVPGVMARVVKALTKENIKILQTADSHSTISCLINGDDIKKAVIALHNEFNLSER